MERNFQANQDNYSDGNQNFSFSTTDALSMYSTSFVENRQQQSYNNSAIVSPRFLNPSLSSQLNLMNRGLSSALPNNYPRLYENQFQRPALQPGYDKDGGQCSLAISPGSNNTYYNFDDTFNPRFGTGHMPTNPTFQEPAQNYIFTDTSHNNQRKSLMEQLHQVHSPMQPQKSEHLTAQVVCTSKDMTEKNSSVCATSKVIANGQESFAEHMRKSGLLSVGSTQRATNTAPQSIGAHEETFPSSPMEETVSADVNNEKVDDVKGKQTRYEYTVKALEKAGLLDITLQTAQLMKKNASLQKDIDMLEEIVKVTKHLMSSET